MKRSILDVVLGLIGAAAMVAVILVASPPARACGYGNSTGGQGFVPQRQDGNGSANFRPAVTRAQAVDIITTHIKRLNPNLHVGNVNDTGPLFEAQVLSTNNEVVQMIGVDKQSGRLVLLN
jgi:hypothetical protein